MTHPVHVVNTKDETHFFLQGAATAHRQSHHEVVVGYSSRLIAVEGMEQAVCRTGVEIRGDVGERLGGRGWGGVGQGKGETEGRGGRDGAYSFVACFVTLATDHASLLRQTTVPTPNRDAFNMGGGGGQNDVGMCDLVWSL